MNAERARVARFAIITVFVAVCEWVAFLDKHFVSFSLFLLLIAAFFLAKLALRAVTAVLTPPRLSHQPIDKFSSVTTQTSSSTSESQTLGTFPILHLPLAPITWSVSPITCDN